MDRSPLLHPVGPEPPGVYWVRRLGVLALTAVLVGGVAYACAAGDGGDSQRLRSDSGTISESPSPSPGPARPHRCAATDLTAQATADAESYPAGVLPHFTVVVRNEGEAPCRLATQSGARVWTVESGSDEVWSTADCDQPGKRSLRRLGPGHQVTYAVVWDRYRSVDGCASAGDEAQPGTYRLLVSVDRTDADPVVFHLTD